MTKVGTSLMTPIKFLRNTYPDWHFKRQRVGLDWSEDINCSHKSNGRQIIICKATERTLPEIHKLFKDMKDRMETRSKEMGAKNG